MSRERPRNRSKPEAVESKSLWRVYGATHHRAGQAIGNAQAWRDTFKEQIPDLAIRIWPDAGELKDIEYLAFMHPDFDELPVFPNLKAMFSRAAGVDDICQTSKTAEGPARQGGTAGRRSDDDGIRHHARSALPSRHAGLSGGSGQSGMAQDTDRPARAKAHRVSGLRNDGQSAGVGVEVARLQGLRVGPLAAARQQRSRFSTAATSSSRFSIRPISPSACCR